MKMIQNSQVVVDWLTNQDDEGGNTELFEEEIMVPFEIWVTTFETGVG